MKRLFIGVPIVSEKAFLTAESWRKNEHLNRNVLKWAKPENWHVTLIFLGNTPESAVPLLQQLTDESYSRIKAFKTELCGVGVFPSTHKPKVLWLGLENIEFLMPSNTRMRELLQQEGFVLDDKPLKPHLTLARVKMLGHRTSFESWLNEYRKFDFGFVAINQVVLYESIFTPSGPDYKPLFVKELE
jgi:2'-5' RNA ligase